MTNRFGVSKKPALVLSYIKENPGCTTAEILESCDINAQDYVSRITLRLREEKLIHVTQSVERGKPLRYWPGAPRREELEAKTERLERQVYELTQNMKKLEATMRKLKESRDEIRASRLKRSQAQGVEADGLSQPGNHRQGGRETEGAR